MTRTAVHVDPDARDAAKQARLLTGQTLTGFINSAIWAHVDLVEDRYHAAKLAGTGGLKAAAAISKMTSAQKDALARANREALAAAGINNDD